MYGTSVRCTSSIPQITQYGERGSLKWSFLQSTPKTIGLPSASVCCSPCCSCGGGPKSGCSS
ncbi:hypothetical protein [Nonomuraea recticatena]|uniref:hypothetical protein n=1 Tax=Nonomuraea recticatena TaxID=46178 RepID=UPI00362207B8